MILLVSILVGVLVLWITERATISDQLHRARGILRDDPDLERTLNSAIDVVLTPVERWKLTHLATGDAERIVIFDGLVEDLASEHVITAEQAERAIRASRVACGYRVR